jgi:DNA repair protein RadC
MRELPFEQIRLVLPDNTFIILKNGSNNHVHLEPYDAIVMVLKRKFNKFVLVHNHPAQYIDGKRFGYTEPSKEDKTETKELIGLCKRNKLILKDHIIVSTETDEQNLRFIPELNGYGFEFEELYSFKENGLIGG